MTHSAFNGDSVFKSQLIEMALQHQEADQYIKGTYGQEYFGEEEFMGCSVGCSVVDVAKIKSIEISEDELEDHSFLAEKLNVPVFVTRLQDCFFENISSEKRATWTSDFFNAIPEGADLEPVLPKFLLFVLQNALQYTEKDSDQHKAINQSIAVMEGWVDTGAPDKEAARAASGAAGAAVWAASGVAARAASGAAGAAVWAAGAAARAAGAASGAAVWAASGAARAAGAAGAAVWAAGAAARAAGAAAGAAAFDVYADHFLMLMRDCA